MKFRSRVSENWRDFWYNCQWRMWEHWKWSKRESEKVIKSAKWEKLKVDQLWAKRNVRSAIGAGIPGKESW